MSGVALIVAHDRARAIGRGGQMPWHLPDDLRRFRALTMGGIVLMGRKTFDSLGKPLPGRENWVLSRDSTWSAPGVRAFPDWTQAREAGQGGRLWVIGGGEVYRLALADAVLIESTEIDTRVEGADTWFPALDEREWSVTASVAHVADERHAHAFAFISRQRRTPAA